MKGLLLLKGIPRSFWPYSFRFNVSDERPSDFECHSHRELICGEKYLWDGVVFLELDLDSSSKFSSISFVTSSISLEALTFSPLSLGDVCGSAVYCCRPSWVYWSLCLCIKFEANTINDLQFNQKIWTVTWIFSKFIIVILLFYNYVNNCIFATF